MTDINIGAVALRLAVALVAGLIVGFEREQREKAAGLRTLALVSTGSAMLVLTASLTSPAEVVRMATGVATGVGFLGAGAILRERGEVIGLTTAATVWVAAALGVSAGLGLFELTALGAVLTLLILAGIGQVDTRRVQSDVRTYEVTYQAAEWREAQSDACFTTAGMSAMLLGIEWSAGRVTATWRVIGKVEQHDEVLMALPGCASVTGFVVTS